MAKKNEARMEAELQASLRAIEDAYVAGLPGRLKDIENSLQRCLDEPGMPEHYDMLLLQLHALAGSAGTFGFSELGFRATDLEIGLNAFVQEGRRDACAFGPLAASVGAFLRWAASTANARNPEPAPAPAPGQQRPAVAASSQTLIYLVHDNALVARDIASQLQYFGYEVAIVAELARLQEAIDRRLPAVVVMDLGFPTGILAGAAEVARIKQANAGGFATIFISTRSNFEARLATVRAGADGYFSKPLDMMALIDRLDALIARDEEKQPCRILIVDDDPQTAARHAAVLREAGMEARILEKVTGLLQTLGEYRPELILMNVYMPTCDGIDLARLIRQDNMYLDVPIVFLSDESNFDKQVDAIESGGDDFLAQPIQPAHLVSALASRVARYRELRSLIMRDSLTGLYNHSAVKESLAREIARARRAETPVSLAMVDIDHFKRINDTYGHPVGDQVIRALSRLLQQRLRRGDIIGRYGGEEFAIVMPGTPASAATQVLDEIRASFSGVRHHAESSDFTATFSAGVAEMTASGESDDLFRVADAALYQAKHDGRDCIRCASARKEN